MKEEDNNSTWFKIIAICLLMLSALTMVKIFDVIITMGWSDEECDMPVIDCTTDADCYDKAIEAGVPAPCLDR